MLNLTNLIILFLHIIAIGALTLFALRMGKEAIIAWISFLTFAANLFVLKQINVLQLNVTASDSIAVGILLGMNVLQEFFGKKEAVKAIWISFFVSCGALMLSRFQLAYIPNNFDQMHIHFEALFSPMPRIIAASLATFFIVQWIDISFFGFLRKKTEGKYFAFRTILALILSQIVDTILFSFMGLFGTVNSIFDVILLSLSIKFLVIILSSPIIILSKKVIRSYA